MVEETKKDAPTSEEIKKEEEEEAELSKEAKEEEVRAQIIEKHGLDEETDSDLINSLVKDKLDDRKHFGKLVGQKREWREKALKKPVGEDTAQGSTDEGEEEEEEDKYITKEELDERDRKRDLDALEVSDELKQEVESYAKLHKVSVKQAFGSKYIQFQKKEEDDKRREEEASAGGTRTAPTVPDLSAKTPEEIIAEIAKIDGSTEEGQKRLKLLRKKLNELG